MGTYYLPRDVKGENRILFILLTSKLFSLICDKSILSSHFQILFIV